MEHTTADLVAGLLPDDVKAPEVFINTLNATSVALQVSTVTIPDDPSHKLRMPIVASDPTADWVAEGEEIAQSKATFAEVIAEYFKLGGLTIHSRESIRDASPQTLDLILAGLARDIARKLDAAYFGTRGVSTVQPPGLLDLAGVNAHASPVTGWANLDTFVGARMDAASKNSTLTSWVTSPTDAALLALIRESDGSNRHLLQPDPTQPTRSLIDGVPVLITPAVAAGSVWGIPRDTSHVVVRQDIEIEANESVFFTSQRVAVIGSARVGFAHTHPEGVVHVTTTHGPG